jgi:hypothetical protein
MRRILRWGMLVVLSLMVMFSIVRAIPPQQASNRFEQDLLDLRNDIELLADFAFPGGQRPDEWKGTDDIGSPSFVADLWFDNELLADEVFGLRVRPIDWIGATTTSGILVVRNVRHDLELSADEVLEEFRPDAWVGGPPLFRCSRTVMNTVFLLDTQFNTRPNTPESVLDYCVVVEDEIEDTLLDQALTQRQVANEDVPEELLAVRGDLERLTDEVLGVNNRPPNWIDNTDIDSPDLAGDIFIDLETLADIVLDPGVRPGAWIGTTQTSSLATLRNLRHDLELLTDTQLGGGNRPTGWQGDVQLTRCEPILQNLVFLADAVYQYQVPDIQTPSRSEYCSQVRRSVNFIVENPPPDQPDPGTRVPDVTDEVDTRYLAESELAFSYLDAAATQFMGVMPRGTEFRAWYRNFNGSTMMFVSGENFALFIDRRWTSLPQNVFNTLPTLEGVAPLTFCDALWCDGPGPTPTPTGSGPLLQILQDATVPPPQVNEVPDADVTGKTLVNWNAIRINYILQQQEQGTAQVTLEICRSAQQILCEPVTSVFNTSINQPVAALSVFNGLNVYELPYGYSTQFVIESVSFFSEDIWLDDPTLPSGR